MPAAPSPCFDEPEYKVPLRLSVDVPAAHLATGECPRRERDAAARKPGHKRVVFKPTPPLPTHLWALCRRAVWRGVGRQGGSRGVPLRILTLRGRETEGALRGAGDGADHRPAGALHRRALPYDKLDQIAVPNQSHAMENPDSSPTACDFSRCG